MSELAYVGAAAIARAVTARSLSAVEVTRAQLARVAQLDEKLNTFISVDEEGALAAARAVDERVARGEALPLAGVPVGVKDLLVTKGLRTTAGSKMLAGWVPPYDATVVERLRAAGAVLLGKLNLDEFAMGSSNENSSFGPCRNPWDPTRVPGGSSGGSAAAVAAGFCAIALGTDTGGSIRQPAALCGVVGMKPTYGRVSRHGVIAYASSLDQVGPLARSVEDCALALSVIAGHDARDSTSLAAAVPDLAAACSGSIDGLRVGVPRALFGKGLDETIAAAIDKSLAQLAALGVKLVDIALPHAEHALAAYYLIATAEASSNLGRYDGVRYGLRVEGQDLADSYGKTRAAGFGDEVKRRIMLGTYALRSGYYDAYYLRAQKVRTLIRRDFDAAFAQCDVIATPTSPVAAFPLGERSADPLAMYLVDVYTIPCNLAGIPGISIPCGFLDDKLPIGLQLLGRPLEEATLLSAASAYERATDWHSRTPNLTTSDAP